MDINVVCDRPMDHYPDGLPPAIIEHIREVEGEVDDCGEVLGAVTILCVACMQSASERELGRLMS